MHVLSRLTYITAATLAVVGLMFFLNSKVIASEICNDVLVVFARGSGQPFGLEEDQLLEKPQLSQFFEKIRARTPEAVSLETREVKYPAVDWPHFGEAKFNWVGELSWGEYSTSVDVGVNNLIRLIDNEVRSCPDQKIILGGYSQGAQVVGTTLNLLGNVAADNIVYAGLFGDPKFKPASFAARGNFSRSVGGVLDSYKNDFPAEFKGKVFSWCQRGDGICESRFKNIFLDNTTHKHAYQGHPIVIAANEAAMLLQNHYPGFQTKAVTLDENSKLDLVLLFDTSDPVKDPVLRIRSGRDKVINTAISLTEDTRIGLAQYRHENAGKPISETLIQLTSSKTDIYNAFSKVRTRERWGNKTSVQPLYSGLLKAIGDQPWRPDAHKRVLYITRLGIQDPEENTGYTLTDVVDVALEDAVNIHPLLTINT